MPANGKYKKESLISPSMVLTAAAIGGIGGIYADKVLQNSDKWKAAEPWKHWGLVGACSVLGAGTGAIISAVKGTRYD